MLCQPHVKRDNGKTSALVAEHSDPCGKTDLMIVTYLPLKFKGILDHT